jgi:hypothetical protein
MSAVDSLWVVVLPHMIYLPHTPVTRDLLTRIEACCPNKR